MRRCPPRRAWRRARRAAPEQHRNGEQAALPALRLDVTGTCTSQMTTARSIGSPPQDKVYWLVALMASFVLINSLVAIADPLALSVTLALPAIPFVLFATLRGMTGDRTYGALLAIVVVFVLAANFRNR